MTQNGEKPEDEKAEHEKSEDEIGAPEVEAEVVGDGDDVSSSAFDETAPEIEEALAGAEEELAPKKSTLTPGVLLFFAFAAVALAAFFIWRLQSGDSAPTTEDVTETAPQVETQAPPAEGEKTDEPDQEAPSLPEPSDKITNTPKDNLTPPSGEAAPDETFLPPVSERGAEKITNTVDAGARETMRRLEEEESAKPKEDQQTDELTGFDIAPENAETLETVQQDEPPSDVTEEEARQGASVDPAAETQRAEIAAEETDIPEETADPSPAATAEIPAKLVNDLEELRGETARLENALAAERERNADLAAQIAELRRGFEAALAARDERYADELAAMRARLDKIQNSEIKGATDQLRANLALNALRRKVDAGEPFADELTAVAEFAPERASALAPYAHSGAPTDAALRESFGPAAREALAAAGQEEAGGGVSGVIARAKSLVSVRPAGPQAGDGPRAVISRAEHAVGEGDLTYALNELDSLPPSAKNAMAEWIGDARARAQAQAVLNDLSQRLNGGGSE